VVGLAGVVGLARPSRRTVGVGVDLLGVGVVRLRILAAAALLQVRLEILRGDRAVVGGHDITTRHRGDRLAPLAALEIGLVREGRHDGTVVLGRLVGLLGLLGVVGLRLVAVVGQALLEVRREIVLGNSAVFRG